jgi:hypothetical protein
MTMTDREQAIERVIEAARAADCGNEDRCHECTDGAACRQEEVVLHTALLAYDRLRTEDTE